MVSLVLVDGRVFVTRRDEDGVWQYLTFDEPWFLNDSDPDETQKVLCPCWHGVEEAKTSFGAFLMFVGSSHSLSPYGIAVLPDEGHPVLLCSVLRDN